MFDHCFVIILLFYSLKLNELANMLNSRETVHGSTAFFKACSMGRRDVVNFFVDEAVKRLGLKSLAYYAAILLAIQ